MKVPSFAEIENGLLPFRVGRGVVSGVLVDALLRSIEITNPLLALSRIFIRLKSADSIAEKLKRKGIEMEDLSDLTVRVPDILGCRVVVETHKELWSVDHWIRNRFEVASVQENVENSNEFGGRGIEYLLRYHDRASVYPVAFQLRTLLQHHWASASFHLFHKQPREVAVQHQKALWALGEALRNAESCIDMFRITQPNQSNVGNEGWSAAPICSRIHIVVVEPGEKLSLHEQHTLTGDDLRDHAAIVARKIQLYGNHPNSAIVECSCLHFLSFMFNEPQICVPVHKLQNLIL